MKKLLWIIIIMRFQNKFNYTGAINLYEADADIQKL